MSAQSLFPLEFCILYKTQEKMRPDATTMRSRHSLEMSLTSVLGQSQQPRRYRMLAFLEHLKWVQRMSIDLYIYIYIYIYIKSPWNKSPFFLVGMDAGSQRAIFIGKKMMSTRPDRVCCVRARVRTLLYIYIYRWSHAAS
jgi:hypothetical protein